MPRSWRIRLSGVVLFSFLAILSVLPAAANEIYINDFSSTVDSSWSVTSGSLIIATSPSGEKFLGTDSTLGFSNNTATLSLSSLPAHTDLTFSFDLYIIHSWDGNSTGFGPDYWKLAIQGGSTLLNTTFAMDVGHNQSYPGNYLSENPAHTGRTAGGTLGYSYNYGTDDTYHLTYTIPHTASSVAIDFNALGLQGIDDESWGLDNVRVEAVPLPPSLLLFGSGLLGLAGLRLRFRKG